MQLFTFSTKDEIISIPANNVILKMWKKTGDTMIILTSDTSNTFWLVKKSEKSYIELKRELENSLSKK